MSSSVNFSIFNDGNEGIENRLRERFARIVEANQEAFDGQRVLDIAANNGRWTYAALASGAKFVQSIEGREDRVADAVKFLTSQGFEGRFNAATGDLFDFLYEARPGDFDTVLCLGIYYHVMDHYHLLKLMTRLEPEVVLIDSGFVRSFRNSVHVQMEDPSKHLNALEVFENQSAEPVGFVSLGLMLQMAWNVGYSCRPVIWDPSEIGHPDDVHDYLLGRRFTLRLNRMSGHHDPDWQEYWRPALAALKPDFVGLLDRSTHDAQMDARVRQAIKNTEFSVI